MRWAEHYNDGTPDSYGTDDYLQLYAENVDWVDAPTLMSPQGRAGGLQALREATASGRGIFRNRRVVIDEIVEDGNRAVWIGSWRATVGVEGFGFPSGTTVEFKVAMFFEVQAELIVRQRDFLTAAVVTQ